MCVHGLPSRMDRMKADPTPGSTGVGQACPSRKNAMYYLELPNKRTLEGLKFHSGIIYRPLWLDSFRVSSCKCEPVQGCRDSPRR